MSTPAPVTLALAADKTSYQPGDELAVTVTAHTTVTVRVTVQGTLPDGSPASGELDIPVVVPAAGFTVSGVSNSLGDQFTQEQGEAGSVVLKTTLGTPAA